MDVESAKATTDKIRGLHAGLKAAIESNEVSEESVREWKQTTAQLFKEFNGFRKAASAADERSRAERAMLREEMRDELVSREAVGARTAERFRAFSEQSGATTGGLFDRASRTAGAIEMSINDISRHSLSVNQGTVLLHEQMEQNGAGF
jgi:hypothetical protein